MVRDVGGGIGKVVNPLTPFCLVLSPHYALLPFPLNLRKNRKGKMIEIKLTRKKIGNELAEKQGKGRKEVKG